MKSLKSFLEANLMVGKKWQGILLGENSEYTVIFYYYVLCTLKGYQGK